MGFTVMVLSEFEKGAAFIYEIELLMNSTCVHPGILGQ